MFLKTNYSEPHMTLKVKEFMELICNGLYSTKNTNQKKKNREKDYSAFFPLTAKYNLIT